MTLSPDQHAAEAERLLERIHTDAEDEDFVAEDVTALAVVANVHALLASRPPAVKLTGTVAPDNELVRRAIEAERKAAYDEHRLTRCETDRMVGEVDRLRYELLSHGQELLDEACNMAPDSDGEAYVDAAETWMAMLQRTLTDAAVPSTGEDQAAPDSARARAGMTVVHKSGSRHVLSHRKEDDSGWWLADKGGVADWILDSDDWQLIFEPVPDEGNAALCQTCRSTGVVSCRNEPCEHGGHSCPDCNATGRVPVPSTGEDQSGPRPDGLTTCAATNEQLMAVCGLAPGHSGQHFDRSNHRGWSDFTLRPKSVPDEGSKTDEE